MNIAAYLDEMDQDTEEKARPLAAELIEKIDAHMTKRVGEMKEHEDVADMIYETEESAIAALVYIICCWSVREAREQEASNVIDRLARAVKKRINAH